MNKPFGKLGTFPQGKIDETDEGALQLGVATDAKRGVVVVNFRTPVTWMGLPRKEALEFAALLVQHANELPELQ